MTPHSQPEESMVNTGLDVASQKREGDDQERVLGVARGGFFFYCIGAASLSSTPELADEAVSDN